MWGNPNLAESGTYENLGSIVRLQVEFEASERNYEHRSLCHVILL